MKSPRTWLVIGTVVYVCLWLLANSAAASTMQPIKPSWWWDYYQWVLFWAMP